MSTMLSIRPSLYQQDAQVKSLQRVISVLLQGIAIHSYRHDQAEYDVFAQTIRKLRADAALVDDEDSLLLLAGAAIRALEEHNQSVERFLSTQNDETQGILTLFTQSLLRVGHGSAESARKLKAIGSDFAAASRVGDLRTLKEQLANSLQDICGEAAVHQRNAGRIRTDLNVAAGHPGVRSVLETSADIDAITGLTGAEAATREITSAWESQRDSKIVLFAIDRLESVNVRYGFKAGDELLLVFSQHIAQHLSHEDQLFRWRGPCFLVLVDRRIPESHLSTEMGRIASARMEHVLKVRDREVMLPITAAWAMISLQGVANPEDLIVKINDFAINRESASRGLAPAAIRR